MNWLYICAKKREILKKKKKRRHAFVSWQAEKDSFRLKVVYFLSTPMKFEHRDNCCRSELRWWPPEQFWSCGLSWFLIGQNTQSETVCWGVGGGCLIRAVFWCYVSKYRNCDLCRMLSSYKCWIHGIVLCFVCVYLFFCLVTPPRAVTVSLPQWCLFMW